MCGDLNEYQKNEISYLNIKYTNSIEFRANSCENSYLVLKLKNDEINDSIIEALHYDIIYNIDNTKWRHFTVLNSFLYHHLYDEKSNAFLKTTENYH